LQFLRNNQDVFAWSKSDLTGVHRSVIEHALNTDPRVKPKLQRQRPMSADRVKSAEAEVQKLLDARNIREVQYPIWVANVVMVPKKNGNMHMCMTSQNSTRHARRTLTRCQGSTSSLIRPPAVTC
jgi:ribosome recycling factor